jgi:hypothetical protein
MIRIVPHRNVEGRTVRAKDNGELTSVTDALPDALRIWDRVHARITGVDEPARPAFEDCSKLQQLDAIEIACRSPFYVGARTEALPESDEYAEFLALLTDSCISDAEIGRRAREIVAKYLQACALRRGDDLAEFVR